MDKKHSLIVLLIFFLYLPLSLAQQISLEKAINLFENEQFQEAADMFFELDDIREDPEVFYYLGRIFSEGLGDIPVRRDVAFDYYKRATEKNHIKAQTEYAIYYLTGEFVLRDYKKAIELLEKSANKNLLAYFLPYGFFNNKKLQGLLLYHQVLKMKKKKTYQLPLEIARILSFSNLAFSKDICCAKDKGKYKKNINKTMRFFIHNFLKNIREKKNIKINFKESFIEIIFCFLVLCKF